MVLKGRKIITSDVDISNTRGFDVIVDIINDSLPTHLANADEILYLQDYHAGEQEVLKKEKSIREDINHKLVINHAKMFTRNIVGYFLGNNIQYIQASTDVKKEQLDDLNRFVQYEDKSSTDSDIAETQSICGTAYRIIYTDGEYADEVPFEERSLDPKNTFVVYTNDISNRPLLACTYFEKYNSDKKKQYQFNVYTLFGHHVFISDNNRISVDDQVSFSPYSVGGIPIIEYPNNKSRMGDWEHVIDLMEAVNFMHSGRLDDVDQVVQSLMAFVNADITDIDSREMIKQGIIQLNSTNTNPASIQVITNPLDHGGMNLFAKELQELLYAIVGVPSREHRAMGGGDTGQAVELRDGWADLEIVAKRKESEFKRSEKRSLRIMLNIINAKLSYGLTLLDIDIKFSRNKTNNLLVKTQGYAQLLSTKTLSPQDCLSIIDITSDVNDYVTRGEEFWGDQFANKVTEQDIANANKVMEKESEDKENSKKEDKKDTKKEKESDTE